MSAVCSRCGRAFKPDAAFCAGCGASRSTPGLRLALGTYLALLAVQVVAMVSVKLGADLLATLWFESFALAAVAIVVAIFHRALVAPAYRTLGWSWRGYALILIAAPFIAATVAAYVHGLTLLFGPLAVDELAAFQGRSIALAIAVVAVGPPLYEEVAFRGLMFGALRESFSAREALFLSSFAFALLHLSIPTLVTHLPLGFYFGLLRYRSGSIWPGTFAHFCHNFAIVIAHHYGLR
jgi:membrane protease YdiL (CAAX protease family)